MEPVEESKPVNKTKMTEEEREQLAAKLDRDLDKFISGLEKRSYTDGWAEDRWQEEMEKHPFFMTKAPETGEVLSPLMEGLQQLKYDSAENTPEELAATYKEDGNFNFKCKKYYLAILSYTEGLKQKCKNGDINAQLYNNRAASNFFLKNYRSCLADCQAAIKIKPGYEKAMIRAAHCYQLLGKYDECIAYCDDILIKDALNKDIVKLRNETSMKKKCAERDKRKENVLDKRAKQKENELIEAIHQRGIKFYGIEGGINSMKQLESTFPEVVQRSVHLQDGRLVWPVILLYPEYQTTDFIQEFHEDTTFHDQLSEVFAEIPEWDIDKKYTIENIKVYFEDKNEKVYSVPLNKTLGQILGLKSYCVDAGTPAFIIVTKGSPSEDRLISNST